jgi:hypothetical protein
MSPAPPPAWLAVLAAAAARDMYPKNVVQPAWAPAGEYQAAFRRLWCTAHGGGEPAAVGVSFIDTPRLHAAVIRLAAGAGGGVLVAFRGTDGLLQRVLNHCCWMQPVELPELPPCDGGGGGGAAAPGTAPHVHAAWWASLQEALPQLRGLVHEALAAQGASRSGSAGGGGGGGGACGPGSVPAAAEPAAQIYLAGHSLGGVFAKLAAALLLAGGGAPAPVGGVFSFGAPRAGDAAWVERYAAALAGVTWAFENAGDGVTSQPPSVPPLLRYAQLPASCLVAVSSPWEDGKADGGGRRSPASSCSGSDLGSCAGSASRAHSGESGGSHGSGDGSGRGSISEGSRSSCGTGSGSAGGGLVGGAGLDGGAAAGWLKPPAAADFAPRLLSSRHNEHAYVDAVAAHCWAASLLL